MTDTEVIKIANEVAVEIGQTFQTFGIERIVPVDDALVITFRWSETLVDSDTVVVIIRPSHHQTGESVRKEIRRQFRGS